jgi:hypothetical protein
MHEDYEYPLPSERHQACIDVAEAIKNMGLGGPTKAFVGRHFQGKYRYVEFGVEGCLDGQVSCYGPNYIQVSYRGTVPGMPPQDRRVFSSPETAIAFLRLAFIDGKPVDALSVPLREFKRRSVKEPQQPLPKNVSTEGAPLSFDADFLSAGQPPPLEADDLTGLLGLPGEDD